MEDKVRNRLIATLFALMSVLPVFAQKTERTDSLVRLMKAESLELIENMGVNYRKVVDATFLHNGTYLICDTALWNVDGKVINAWGNVKVMQDETMLTSDKMDYMIDDDLIQCRGPVVQLQNKKNNILRTKFLDYNTKDSIAVFKNGASMRDKDGQVIESVEGTYDSRRKVFDFQRNVNMFTDSVFVKTARLRYEADPQKAYFNAYVDFWKGGSMLSAETGWYDRGQEVFFFSGWVHGLTEDQELWSDTLYFYRGVNDVELFGNAQVRDTTRNAVGYGDYIFYQDSLSRITMEKNAAVELRTEQDDRTDTLWFGADRIVFESIRKCDIPQGDSLAAASRLSDMFVDPVAEYRRKAAEEAAAKAAEAAKSDPNQRGKGIAAARAAGNNGGGESEEEEAAGSEVVEGAAPTAEEMPAEVAPTQENTEQEGPEEDAPAVQKDTLKTPTDSLKTPSDSLANVEPPKDTTEIGFMRGVHNVRIFRRDIQARCDSMVFTQLDSIARFYESPVVWNDGNRQYTADSLFVLVHNGTVDRASLQSNAFIITQEDSLLFDQIKGAEVMAYFDSTAALKRFDALGGAQALFYLRENDALATANKVECKMLSANMKDGQMDRVHYFQEPHNDAYPIAQMTAEDQRMKGFNWQAENRPSSPKDITELVPKASERTAYENHTKCRFLYTDVYFPGYMNSVYKAIEHSDSVKQASKKPAEAEVQDVQKDTLVKETPLADGTLDDQTLQPQDTTKLKSQLDTLANTATAPADTLEKEHGPADLGQPVDEKELRRQKKAEAAAKREEIRKLKIAARDARWAELDAKDAAKAEAKAAKALEKKRESTRKAVLKKMKMEAKEERKIEKYVSQFEKQKERNPEKFDHGKQQQEESESAGERPQTIEGGGDIQTAPEL